MNRSDSEKRWCQKVYEYLKRENSPEGVLLGRLPQVIDSGSLNLKGKVKTILRDDDRFNVPEGMQSGSERVYLKSTQMLPPAVLPLLRHSVCSLRVPYDFLKRSC